MPLKCYVEDLVAQTFTNWNQITNWLIELQLFRQTTALALKNSIQDRVQGLS